MSEAQRQVDTLLAYAIHEDSRAERVSKEPLKEMIKSRVARILATAEEVEKLHRDGKSREATSLYYETIA